MPVRANRLLPRVTAVGAQAEVAEVKCRRGNNPYGHPASCPCRRAAQTVPYDEPEPDLPPSPHQRWWTPVKGDSDG